MTIIEDHANWNISRELGFNYCHTGLVRWQAFFKSDYVLLFSWSDSSWDLSFTHTAHTFFSNSYMCVTWCHRVTDWHGTTPWLTATMSSYARCVTETRCLKSLSRRKTFYGGTGNVCALVYHNVAFLGGTIYTKVNALSSEDYVDVIKALTNVFSSQTVSDKTASTCRRSFPRSSWQWNGTPEMRLHRWAQVSTANTPVFWRTSHGGNIHAPCNSSADIYSDSVHVCTVSFIISSGSQTLSLMLSFGSREKFTAHIPLFLSVINSDTGSSWSKLNLSDINISTIASANTVYFPYMNHIHSSLLHYIPPHSLPLPPCSGSMRA